MSAERKFQAKRPLQCYFRAEAILSLFSSSFHFPDAMLSLALGSPHRHKKTKPKKTKTPEEPFKPQNFAFGIGSEPSD